MECFQNISLVPSDSYLVVKDALNVPSLIDEVGHALRRPEQPSLDPIEPDDPSLGISNQGKRQTVLLLESPMALYGVRAHPYRQWRPGVRWLHGSHGSHRPPPFSRG